MGLKLLQSAGPKTTWTHLNSRYVLSCQPVVTVTSCFVYKVIKDLESIDHLCINPIRSVVSFGGHSGFWYMKDTIPGKFAIFFRPLPSVLLCHILVLCLYIVKGVAVYFTSHVCH